MDTVENDFKYEKAFAVNVAAARYPTFAAYATEHSLSQRFTREQVAELMAVWQHWHAVINDLEPALA